MSANPRYHLRSPERIAALFEGLELVEPGVVSVNEWKPDPTTPPDIIDQYCAVARKPYLSGSTRATRMDVLPAPAAG